MLAHGPDGKSLDNEGYFHLQLYKREEKKTMYRLTHIDSGFEWSFATLAEAIEYLETFERQEEFEIRR